MNQSESEGGVLNQSERSSCVPVDLWDLWVVFEQRGSLDAAASCFLRSIFLWLLLLLWCPSVCLLLGWRLTTSCNKDSEKNNITTVMNTLPSRVCDLLLVVNDTVNRVYLSACRGRSYSLHLLVLLDVAALQSSLLEASLLLL